MVTESPKYRAAPPQMQRRVMRSQLQRARSETGLCTPTPTILIFQPVVILPLNLRSLLSRNHVCVCISVASYAYDRRCVPLDI